MKKGLQLSAAALIALSAITPVAAAAAETPAAQVQSGIYTTEGFTSIPDFKKLTTAQKAALLSKPGAVLVAGPNAVPTNVIIAGTNADIEAATVTVEKYQQDNNVTLDSGKGINVGAPAAALTVESVSAINKTGVDVAITATTEALTGVTIEVKDNKGNVVEVKPVDLVKGETVASFKFEKELTVDPEGVWTVAGISVDLDLKANLEAVYNYENQVKLLEGLNKLGLTDVNADNIIQYADAIDTLKDSTKDTYVALEDFTKAVAQEAVIAGNKAAAEATDEEAVVKAVNEAKNEVALLNALASFDRVNSDWIAAYDAALGTSETDIKSIQGKIDTANATKLSTGVTSPVGKLDLAGEPSIVKKDLTEAKALVSAYQKPDGEGETAKADLLNQIDVQLAIVAVLEAQTPAQLTVAINGLKAVDAAYVLDMDNYKDANRAAYIEKFKGEAANDKNTILEINGLLLTVNGEQADLPIDAIKNATNANELLAALKSYGDAKYVADANKAFYWANYNAGTNQFDSVSNKATVQAAIDEANLAAVVDATTTPATTAEKENALYAALVAYGNGIKDLNVNNKAQYLAVAIDATGAEDTATGLTAGQGFADITTSTATATIKPQIQALVDIANIDALNAQTTATGVLAKLNIISQLKNVKAENAKAYLFEVTDGSGTIKALDGSNADGSQDRTITNLQTAINDVNTAEAANVGVKAVNEATTATALRDILTDLVVSGDVTAASYLNLTNADKLIVAELFLDDDVFTANGLAAATRTNLDSDNKYQALGDIGTDLEAVAAAVDTLRTDTNAKFAGKAVGHADTSIANVQTELAKLVKANYTAYDALTGTQKLAAAEAFIAAFPVNADGDTYLAGYTTFGAYTAAVDAAIAASK